MTDRLYYHDSFLYNFDAEVRSIVEGPRPGLILDRTAFYPTSGGQIHDTGWIVPGDSTFSSGAKLRVTEVAEAEDGHVVHYLEAPLKNVQPGTRVGGEIDVIRRRDHMQQHSAQHVLSAVFVRLFNMSTVSFHMAHDYCSIDLEMGDLEMADLGRASLDKAQIEAAEHLANEIVLENRAVDIRFVTRSEADKLGLRKVPPASRDQLRLIGIEGFDLTACGGTHVSCTGQIGAILLRKAEKVRQGYRLEFVAGQRAIATARQDFSTLTETAALFSSHIYDLPQQARKSLDEIKSLGKRHEQSQEELAAVEAAGLLAELAESGEPRVISRSFSGRDLNYLKALAHKLTKSSAVIALLATKSPQPAMVFAQSPGQAHNMGLLLKETMAKLGGRGGGSKDFAQGGAPKSEGIEDALAAAAQTVKEQ